MSIANALLQSDTVVAFCDTLVSADGHPISFQAKVAYLPAPGVLIAGRGIKEIHDAFTRAADRSWPGADIDELAQEAPAFLRSVWPRYFENGKPALGSRTTIWIWGWSDASDRFVGYGLSSQEDFAAQPADDGILLAPGLDDIEGAAFSDMDDIARRQHDFEIDALRDLNLPHRQIGGDLIAYQLTRHEGGTFCAIAPRFRFATYGEDLAKMSDGTARLYRRHLGRLEERAVAEEQK